MAHHHKIETMESHYSSHRNVILSYDFSLTTRSLEHLQGEETDLKDVYLHKAIE